MQQRVGGDHAPTNADFSAAIPDRPSARAFAILTLASLTIFMIAAFTIFALDPFTLSALTLFVLCTFAI
jgi:hypothetical protein